MSRTAVVVAATVLVLGGVVAAVLLARGNNVAESSQIKVEVRAMPTATIRVDGKNVGTTPLALAYPRSGKQIEIEATMTRHLVNLRGGSKDEVYVDRRTVTLDRDALIDFEIRTAKRVEEHKSP